MLDKYLRSVLKVNHDFSNMHQAIQISVLQLNRHQGSMKQQRKQPYYHLHSIVTPRREMKVVSSFPTRVIIIQLYVLYFKLLIRGRERLQPSATSRK